ncbi:MAG TPA: hypothetical protein VNH16_11445 [Burkholderiales bacterium]|jgi:hypothetical protein|nr:hypothetical protein [Burkholderiales bacterium]
MGLLGSDKPALDKSQPQSTDDQAIERYRYMLKTAPPETIEQAHAEAFAQLTPEQRRLLLQKLAEGMPASERSSAEQGGANPQALARLATRAEIRKPGAMERMVSHAGGAGMGGVLAGSVLGSIAGTVLGSMIAREFFAGEGHGAGFSHAGEPGQEEGFTDTDQALDDGDGFDAGGGFDDVA